MCFSTRAETTLAMALTAAANRRQHPPPTAAPNRRQPPLTSGTAGTWGTHANQLESSTPRLPAGCIELSLGRHVGNTEQASRSTGQS